MLSLRDSGKLVGASVSVRQVALTCALPFPLSLRRFMGTRGCPFSSWIPLHLKVWVDPVSSVAPPSGPLSIGAMLSGMREVYSTAGIGVKVLSHEDFSKHTLNVVTSLRDLDVIIDQPRGKTTIEQRQLFDNRNRAAENEIVVHFIRSTQPTAYNGCAAHPDGQPGVVITQIASRWTLAHEVAHALGLEHIDGERDAKGNCTKQDVTRLMTGCSTDNIVGTPRFDKSELDAISGSPLIHQG
jgi:hypothetical protein